MPYLQQDPNEEQNQTGGSSSGAASPSSATSIGGGGSSDPTQPGQSAGASYAGDGGQGATTTTAGSGAGPAATSPGGGYTNLLSYLSANQGAGATTGQAAANTVQQTATDAGAKQDAYKTAASGQIDQAASGLGVDQGVLGKINAGASTTDPNVLKQIQQGGYVDPTAAGASGAGVGNATGKYQGPAAPKTDYAGPDASSLQVAYNGPNSYSALTGDASAAQTAALGAGKNVAEQAKLAQGNQADVSGLLRSTYTQPNYSAGENSLDAFLAGGTQGGRDALSSTKGIADTTASGYQGINDMLTGKIQGARDTAAATNAAYSGAVDQAKAQSAKTAQQYQSAIDQATQAAAAHKVGPINNTIGGPFSIAVPEAKNPQDNNDFDTGLRSVGGYVNQQYQDQMNKLKDPLGTTERSITDPLWTTRTALPDAWQTASAGQNVANAASTLTNPVTNANPVNTTKAAVHSIFGAAHGGEVPYGGLMKKIGGWK